VRRWARGVLRASLALASSAWAATARGDPDENQRAAALFDEGRRLVERGQVSEACPKFAESQRVDPGIGTQLWLADCYESVGQTASAWMTFKEAAAEAALHKDGREKVGRERAAALESKLSRMMIVVSDRAAAQGLEVKRDGMTVALAEWGTGVPLDPGEHTLAVSAPGRQPWSTTVQLAARPETLQVTVPPLEPVSPDAELRSPPAPPALTLVAGAPPRSSEPVPHAGHTVRVIEVTLAGAGVVGLGVGTFFSIDAKSTYDASNRGGHCSAGNQCDATGQADRADARSKAAVATVAMGTGAAFVVGGALLYWLSPRTRTFVVTAGPEHGGASARFSTAW
jgi:hypothetical protein